MDHVVNPRRLNLKTRVCGGQNGTGKGSMYPYVGFLPAVSFYYALLKYQQCAKCQQLADT
jgi:hypothetical protein